MSIFVHLSQIEKFSPLDFLTQYKVLNNRNSEHSHFPNYYDLTPRERLRVWLLWEDEDETERIASHSSSSFPPSKVPLEINQFVYISCSIVAWRVKV